MKAKMNIKSIVLTTLVIYLVSMLFINIVFAANTGKINVEAAKLREEPTDDCKTLEIITMGEEVEILEENDNFYKVEYKKITGYVRKDLIDIENKIENNINIEDNVETTSEETTENRNIEETSPEEEILKGEKYKMKENTKIKVIPLINSIQLNELPKDTEIEVTEILNDWFKVKTSDGKLGWIRKDKILTKKEEAEQIAKLEQERQEKERQEKERQEKEEKAKQAQKIASTTTSRNGTTTRNTQTTTTTATTNAATESNTTSTKAPATTPVVTPAEATQISDKGNQVVAYAKQFIGSKYVYGGTTPRGFDCSGFTQYVYKHFGVTLNRTAAAQYSNGTAVNNLQAGDLVMFGKSGINHVGIYIGENMIIHAANTGSGVKTDSLSSGYYKNNYVGARRIF